MPDDPICVGEGIGAPRYCEVCGERIRATVTLHSCKGKPMTDRAEPGDPLDEVEGAIQKALDEVSRICYERWNGGHGWRTSIPAMSNYDSDIILTDALSKARQALRDARQRVQELEATISVDFSQGERGKYVERYNAVEPVPVLVRMFDEEIPFFFDVVGVQPHPDDVERQHVYYCGRCGLGLIHRHGTMPSCNRCQARNWTASHEKAVEISKRWHSIAADVGTLRSRVADLEAALAAAAEREARYKTVLEYVERKIDERTVEHDWDTFVRTVKEALS